MKKIYSKFDKKVISGLPVVAFPGRIIVIISARETERAVDYLLSQDTLGVDTETRPSFRKGHCHMVSLLQVSTRTTCFLFRLNKTGFTPAIKRLLENKNVPMVGLSLHDDIHSLKRRGAFEPGRFIDLQDKVKSVGIEDMSLQKLFANLFHKKISKRQQLTNWDSGVLTDRQRIYAATDAWACIMIYDELMRLMQTKDYELIKVTDTQNSNNTEQ